MKPFDTLGSFLQIALATSQSEKGLISLIKLFTAVLPLLVLFHLVYKGIEWPIMGQIGGSLGREMQPNLTSWPKQVSFRGSDWSFASLTTFSVQLI